MQKKRKKTIPAKPLDPSDLTIERIELETGIETGRWHGNCYGVACAILKHGLIEGTAIYGHYHGPIHRRSIFSDRTFTHHGWIETPDGTLVDPTRWVFEATDPYLFIADAEALEKPSTRWRDQTIRDEYDTDGTAIRQKHHRPCPQFHSKMRVLETQEAFVLHDEDALAFVRDITGYPPEWTYEQLFWLANLAIPDIEPFAQDIYEALIEAGLTEFIPIDHRRTVLHENEVSNVQARA